MNPLNWKHQINSTLKVRQNTILIKWGSSQNTLNNTYRTYMKPVIKYGNEAVVIASTAKFNQLEAQNSVSKQPQLKHYRFTLKISQ